MIKVCIEGDQILSVNSACKSQEKGLLFKGRLINSTLSEGNSMTHRESLIRDIEIAKDQLYIESSQGNNTQPRKLG